MQTESRFDIRLPYYLAIAVVCSFVLSIFLFQLFAALLSLLWLSERIQNKRNALDWFSLLILIFGVVRLAAILFSEYPNSSIQALYKEALFYFTFFSLQYYLKAFDNKRRNTVLYAFALAAVAISVIGLVRFNIGVVARAESFTSGYATFSSYLLCGLGVFISFYNYDKKVRYYNWLWAAGTAIIISGIITSLGRANAAIAAIILLSLWMIFKIKLKYIASVFVLSIIICFISFNNNSLEIEQRIEAPSQLSDRDIIYEGAGALAFEHPFLGFGPRTFGDIFPFRDKFADKGIGSWHNDLLEIYFESGVLGLAAYLLLIFGSLGAGIKMIRRELINEREKMLIAGILAAAAGLFLSSLVAGFINSPVLAPVFAFLTAMLSAVKFGEKQKSLKFRNNQK